MKHFALFLALTLILTLPAYTQGEKYNVLNVVGQIKVKASGKMVSKGDVISSEDQVVFMAGNAMAAVFSPSKGRFTLKPKPDQKTGGEYFAFVKSSIVPATQVLAAREVEAPGYKAPDAADEICGAKLLLLPNTAVVVSDLFPVDADHFFFIRMEWSGEEVSKKLTATDGRLHLNPAEILVVDEKPIPASEASNFRMFHFDNTSKNATLVCAMTPVFAAEADLVSEASILVNAGRSAKVAEDQIRTEVNGYLTDYYGRPVEATFLAWYDSHFKL